MHGVLNGERTELSDPQGVNHTMTSLGIDDTGVNASK